MRPGSVREARLEAGLSLAEVADGEVSRAAIHLVETGRSRPSMPTLELIARRTGKPLSYFMRQVAPVVTSAPAEVRERLAELERRVLAGEHETALALAEELLEAPLGRWDEAQARLLAGRARIETGRRQAGLAQVRRARTLFEDLGDEWLAVECLEWEAAGLGEDPAAFELAREALERCRLLDPIPVDLESRILTRLAAKHLQRHEWEEAIECYGAALELSRTLRDLGRMARLYDGLAGAYRELGNFERAHSHAQKAIALHAVARDRTMLARSENNLGLLLVEQGRFDEAARHLGRSLELCGELGVEAGRAHVLLSLAELEIARGDHATAESFLAEARALATRHQEPLTLAYAHQLAGRLAAAAGDAVRCDSEYQEALVMMQGARAGDRLVQCHAEYAEALEQRGEVRRALEHWRLAVAAGRPGGAATGVDLRGGWRITADQPSR